MSFKRAIRYGISVCFDQTMVVASVVGHDKQIKTHIDISRDRFASQNGLMVSPTGFITWMLVRKTPLSSEVFQGGSKKISRHRCPPSSFSEYRNSLRADMVKPT